jgi:hypothetical protein
MTLRHSEVDTGVTFPDDESDASDVEIFSHDSSETSSICPYDTDDSDNTDDSDDSDDEEDCPFEDEEQHPPEYYLAEAESLDVSRLRQHRYGPKTREKLEDTWGYWDR